LNAAVSQDRRRRGGRGEGRRYPHRQRPSSSASWFKMSAPAWKKQPLPRDSRFRSSFRRRRWQSAPTRSALRRSCETSSRTPCATQARAVFEFALNPLW